jgi:hypothetical protein
MRPEDLLVSRLSEGVERKRDWIESLAIVFDEDVEFEELEEGGVCD